MFSAENRSYLPGTLLFLLFLTLYTATLQQTVATADNAEFQLVGLQFGLAHPPGFPLYTMLSSLAARFPFPQAAHVKINFLSSLTSSLTLLIVYRAGHRLTGSHLTSVLAAAMLGTATTFWQQAVYANIRSLTALFAALCLWSLIERQTAASAEKRRRYTLLFALSLGFGFTHHLSLAFMGLVMVGWLLIQDWRSWQQLPVGLIGLLPWLYLPLASAELRDVQSFLTYALGLGFGGDFFSFISPTDLWARTGVMLNVLTFQFHWGVLLLAIVGGLICWRGNRPIAILLTLTFVIHTAITATYRAPQTVEYMLPAYVPLAILTAQLGQFLQPSRHWWWRVVAAMGLAALVVFQLGSKWPSFRALSAENSAESVATELLQAVPSEGRILSNWHWYNTLRYVQQTQGLNQSATVHYVVPQGESYAHNWIDQINQGIATNTPTVATNTWPQFSYQLPPSRSLEHALIWEPDPSAAPQDRFSQTDIKLGDVVQLSAYQAARGVAVGEETQLNLSWGMLADSAPFTLFVHLVGEDGQLYAQHDVPARELEPGVGQTQFRLTPRWGAIPGSYQLLVGAYLADGTPLLNSADNPRAHLADIEVRPSGWAPHTSNPLWRHQRNGRILIGYDIDCTLPDRPRSYHHFRERGGGYFSQTFEGYMPPSGIFTEDACQSYVPLGHGIFWLGTSHPILLRPTQTLNLTQQFVSTRPVVHDLAVSVSLTGFMADNTTWAWQDLHDSIPAMGAIPTLKWIDGSRVRDPHWVTVSAEATSGQRVEAHTIVYDAFSNRPVPVLDERIVQLGNGIPLFTRPIAP